jgi:hypothetical protein
MLANITVVHANAVDESSTTAEVRAEDELHEQCRLYFAPLSIPHTGYGIYSTQDLDQGDVILHNDGLNIAIVDIERDGYTNWRQFDDVWWGIHGGMSVAMAYKSTRYGGYDVYDFQIMFGALPNYHPSLWNLEIQQPDIVVDDSVVNRWKHPGAGGLFVLYRQKLSCCETDSSGTRNLFRVQYMEKVGSISEESSMTMWLELRIVIWPDMSCRDFANSNFCTTIHRRNKKSNVKSR